MWRCVCIGSILAVFSTAIMGQKEEWLFSETPIVEVIEKIESRSKWTFNFSKELIAPYSFSGAMELQHMEEALAKLLKRTPFDFEIVDQNILIFLADKNTYRLCGKTINQLDGSPLSFASIFIEGTALGTQSDEKGTFDWTFEAYKNQQIQVQYLGLKSRVFLLAEWPAEGCMDVELSTNFDLYTPAIVIKDYLLTGITEGEDFGQTILDFDLLAQNYNTPENDVLRTVQLLPGINSIDESATNLNIRGSTPDQNLILWEDVTLYDAGHVFGMISSINPFVVDSIQVNKGVFAPRYDNRVGGIIDVSLTDEIPQKINAGIGSTLTEAHAYLNIPIIKDKLSFLLTGRQTTNGLFNSPTLSNFTSKIFQETSIQSRKKEASLGFLQADEKLNFLDWNTKIIFKPIEPLSLNIATYQAENSYEFSDIFEEPTDNIRLENNEAIFSNSEALSVALNYKWNDTHRTELYWNYSKYENLFDARSAEIIQDLYFFRSEGYNQIKESKWGIDHTWNISKNIKINGGYNVSEKQVDFLLEESELIGANFSSFFSDSYSEAGNFINIYQAISLNNEKQQLDVGWKTIHFREASQTLFSPRLSYQLKLKKNLKLKTSLGRFYQYIRRLENFVEPELTDNVNVWLLSDPEFPGSLRSDKFSLGLIYQSQGWLIDLDAYINRTTGISTISTRLDQTVIDDFTGSSLSRGIDLLIKKSWRQYQLWFNYSLSKNTFLFNNFSPSSFAATNDQPHRLSLINALKLGSWQFNLTYRFFSGLPFSQATQIIERENEDGERFPILNYESVNDLRLPDYHRVDLNIAHKTTLFNDQWNAEFQLSILNLFNTTNLFSRESRIFNVEEDNEEVLRIFDIEKRQLSRTPQLMLRLHW